MTGSDALQWTPDRVVSMGRAVVLMGSQEANLGIAGRPLTTQPDYPGYESNAFGLWFADSRDEMRLPEIERALAEIESRPGGDLPIKTYAMRWDLAYREQLSRSGEWAMDADMLLRTDRAQATLASAFAGGSLADSLTSLCGGTGTDCDWSPCRAPTTTSKVADELYGAAGTTNGCGRNYDATSNKERGARLMDLTEALETGLGESAVYYISRPASTDKVFHPYAVMTDMLDPELQDLYVRWAQRAIAVGFDAVDFPHKDAQFANGNGGFAVQHWPDIAEDALGGAFTTLAATIAAETPFSGPPERGNGDAWTYALRKRAEVQLARKLDLVGVPTTRIVNPYWFEGCPESIGDWDSDYDDAACDGAGESDANWDDPATDDEEDAYQREIVARADYCIIQTGGKVLNGSDGGLGSGGGSGWSYAALKALIESMESPDGTPCRVLGYEDGGNEAIPPKFYADTGEANPPTMEVCGDGATSNGEECDDGNTTSGDGCDQWCRLPDVFVVAGQSNAIGYSTQGADTEAPPRVTSPDSLTGLSSQNYRYRYTDPGEVLGGNALEMLNDFPCADSQCTGTECTGANRTQAGHPDTNAGDGDGTCSCYCGTHGSAFASWEGGSPWPTFARRYMQDTGREVLLIDVTLGGQALIYDGDGAGPSPLFYPYADCSLQDTDYNNQTGDLSCGIYRAADLAGVADRVKGVLWVQGEAEVSGGTSSGDYATALQALSDLIDEEYGRTVPLLVATVSNRAYSGDSCTDATGGFARIKAGQELAIAADPNIYPGPNLDQMTFAVDLFGGADCTHYYDQELHGELWYDAARTMLSNQGVAPVEHLLGVIPASADIDVTLAFLTDGPAAMREAGAQVIHFYRSITELSDGNIGTVMGLLGSPTVISVSIFNGSSVGSLPDTASCNASGWTDATCQSDIASAIATFVATYAPHALVLGTEIEVYHEANPGSEASFVTLSETIRDAVRAVNPDVKVYPGFGYDPTKHATYDALISNEMDGIALNVYSTSALFDPGDPADIVTKLDAALAYAESKGLPMVVPETGRTSSTFLGSSEAEQDESAALTRAWFDAHMEVPWMTFFTGFDCQPDFTAGQPCYQRAAGLAEGTPTEEIFEHIAYLGLCRNDGTCKDAWATLFGEPLTALDNVQCADQIDNDGDGTEDFADGDDSDAKSNDAGCADANDDDESDDPAPPTGLVAAFTATPVDTVCVAPCVVHFDATATTEDTLTREFHELTFEWDFDDAAVGGTWSTGAAALTASPASRNADRGPLAAHVYTVSGSYDPILNARAPDGDEDQDTDTITVVDPDVRFASGETYCFSTSGTFTGCTGTNVTTSDLDTALTDCFDGGSNERRCRFNGAETFVASAGSTLPNVGTGNLGRIDSFGTGRAEFDLQINTLGFIVAGNRWTITDVEITCSTGCGSNTGGIQLNNEVGNFTIHNVQMRNMRLRGVSHAASNSTNFSDLIAVSSLDNLFPTGLASGYCVYMKAARLIIIGTVCDHDGNQEFTVRTVHNYKSLIAHSEFLDPAQTNLNLRAWGGTANCAVFPGESPDLDNCAHTTGPVATDSEWVLVRDNVLRAHNSGTAGRPFIIICHNNECQDPGLDCEGACPHTGSAAEFQNVLIEDNFFTWVASGSSESNYAIGRLQGGDITIRNNIRDAQDAPMDVTMLMTLHRANAASDVSNDDNIHVIGNTDYTSGDPVGVTPCSGGSVGSGHVCQLNVVHAPNMVGGTFVSNDGGGWATTTGNIMSRSGDPDPFDAAIPSPSDPSDFVLDAASSAKDTGVTPASGTSLTTDFGGLCRPAGASRDAGAWEQGASSCP